MNQDARVYSMMVEPDRAVPMIEQIDQIMHALLDHDLIVPITSHTEGPLGCSNTSTAVWPCRVASRSGVWP